MSKLEPCQIISGSAPVIYVYVCSVIDYGSTLETCMQVCLKTCMQVQKTFMQAGLRLKKDMQVPKTFFEIEKKLCKFFK